LGSHVPVSFRARIFVCVVHFRQSFHPAYNPLSFRHYNGLVPLANETLQCKSQGKVFQGSTNSENTVEKIFISQDSAKSRRKKTRGNDIHIPEFREVAKSRGNNFHIYLPIMNFRQAFNLNVVYKPWLQFKDYFPCQRFRSLSGLYKRSSV
jgi:hypothetical protein